MARSSTGTSPVAAVAADVSVLGSVTVVTSLVVVGSVRRARWSRRRCFSATSVSRARCQASIWSVSGARRNAAISASGTPARRSRLIRAAAETCAVSYER